MGFGASGGTGPGGFGNRGTPNGVDRTPWHTSEIWLRREIILPDRPEIRGMIARVSHLVSVEEVGG